MTSGVRFIHTDELSSAVDYPYAGVVPADARLVFLSGAAPIDMDGSTMHVGDHAEQAKVCVANMRTALRAAGATVDDLVFVRMLVATRENADILTAWAPVRESLGTEGVPCTVLGVTVLGYPDQLVEIEAVAALVDE